MFTDLFARESADYAYVRVAVPDFVGHFACILWISSEINDFLTALTAGDPLSLIKIQPHLQIVFSNRGRFVFFLLGVGSCFCAQTLVRESSRGSIL